MTPLEIRKFIVKSVRADLAELQPELERDRKRPGSPLIVSRRWRKVLNAAHDGDVEYRPAAWLGRELTGAERTAFSRELERMQDDGVIERVTTTVGNRTTHVRLLRGEGAPNPTTEASAT